MNPNTCDENQDKKNSDPTAQANSDVAIYIHAVENEEEDVRRAIVCEEKIDLGERGESLDSKVAIDNVKDNMICNIQIVAWQDQGQAQRQGGYWQGQPQGQGGYWQGQPPQGQGGYWQGQPPQGQGGYLHGQPQAQGGYWQGQPQGQGQPPQGQQGGLSYGWGSLASGTPMLKEDRRPFIQKVFFVLFLCISATCAFAVATFVIPGTRGFFASPIGVMLGILGIMMCICMTYVMMCSECSRKAPCNCICLILTVIGECLFFGWVTARYQLRVILLALVVTSIIVLICFGLAFTPLDFTKCYMYLVVIGAALLVFSIAFLGVQLVLKERFPMIHLILGLALTVFQSISFIMQIQMILGGKTVELGVDDWAVGTYMLYTSIMTIFFDILHVLNILDYI